MSLSWVKQIILYCCLSIISAIIYEISLNKNFLQFWGKIRSAYSLNEEDAEEFYSSVSCHGNSHTNRQCRFKNLCYDSTSKAFMFFHSSKSIIIGVPDDRFSPALSDFSSVYDHNTQYFNFIDLPHSAFSNFSVNFINGISMLFKRFNPENLMHVFHDDLIPAFVTLNEIFLLDKSDVQFVFADGREPGPYADLYGKFLVTKPIYLNSSLPRAICFANAIVGLNKNSLWYQYGFKQPQGPLNKDMSTIFPILMHFRKYFYKQFSINEVATRNTALLLTRGYNRKILNAEAVAQTVEMKIDIKTYFINLENYSVIDVIKEIMMCKLVIGMHGSLLILSIFLSPNSHIIELFPYAINPDICTPYKTLAEIPGLELTYHSWENKIDRNSVPHPEYPPELGGISHLPKNLQESIKNSNVKPFLCCYNPEWLYRIYQDTIVDLYSFSDVVSSVLQKNQGEINSGNKRLYPSEVQHISCKLSLLNMFNITWMKPWNVDFMDFTSIEYELWYQDGEQNDVKAFIMKKDYFIFKENVSKSIYVWIRCHIDGRVGPFNADPLICLNIE